MATFNNGESGSSVRTKINAVLQHTDGTAGELVINEAGADVDFRVESDTNVHALFLDGASGNVGIGTSSPAAKLHLGGSTNNEVRVDTTTSGYLQLGQFTNGGFIGTSSTDVTAGVLRFGTGDTERLRIDASGNVGIGVSNPSVKLDVNGPAQLRAGGYLLFLNSDNTNSYYVQNSGATGSGNSVLDFVQGGVGARMRIDASGNLGLGVVPSAWVGTYGQRAIQISAGSISALDAGAGNRQLNLSNNGVDFAGGPFYLGTDVVAAYRMIGREHHWSNAPSGTAGNPITFTQAMTLDASGNLLVGTTTSNGVGWTINPNGSGQIRSSATISQDKIQFANGNGVVGAITTNGTATIYNTSSDYRLKEDLQPIADASSRLAALNPVNFAWKADGTRTDGFIAHEVQAVIPQAVTGEKDGEAMQAIDHSKLVPLLTAALQEALAKIVSLEARLDAANL